MTDPCRGRARRSPPTTTRYNASLVRREDQHDSLAYFWVSFDGEPTPFEPRPVHDHRGVRRRQDRAAPVLRRVGRRGTPATTGYEFYVRLVEGGTFTPLLWRLPVGHRMRMIGPKGKFVLEPDDDRTHLFISSGTGIAPFVSMMRETLADGAPRRVGRSSTACRYERDLGYRELLEGWRRSGDVPGDLRARPSRGRPTRATPAGPGRTGRAETVVAPVLDELGLDPDDTIAYICGNPDMIIAAEQTLLEPGFPEAAGQEGAVLAQGQGTARRGRRRGRGGPGGPQRRRMTPSATRCGRRRGDRG